MARIAVEGNNVHLYLTPFDTFWTMHGSLTIPLAHITLARVEDESGWHHLWRKVIGTNAPGLKMAGTFYLPGGLAFLDYADGKNCLVLETQHETYKSVIVQLDRDQDPDAFAAELNRRIGKT